MYNYQWDKATSEPVVVRDLPKAVKNAKVIGSNIFKSLRGNAKLDISRIYNVPFGNTLCFKEDEYCKAYQLTADGDIVGVIVLNVFGGVSARELSLNFESDRYKTTTDTIVCLSAGDDCAYCANLIMFSSAFDFGALSLYICDWKLPVNNNIDSQLTILSLKEVARRFQSETASDFNFEERD